MKEMLKLVVVMAIISALTGAVLSFTYINTRVRIAEEERKDFLRGLDDVLPDYDNDILAETIDKEGVKVYVAKLNNEPIGYAMESVSEKGYGGTIRVVIGVAPDGEITGVYIVKHSETPSLGDKIKSKEFLSLFSGLRDYKDIAVKSDGGVIDQFSGATISPRAVAEAVANGLRFIRENVIGAQR